MSPARRRGSIRTRISIGLSLAIAALCAPSTAFAQGALSSGGRHDGAISTPSEVDAWTFAASAGDTVILRYVLTSPPSGVFPGVRLRDPSGTQIATNSGYFGASLVVTAALGGTYTVDVTDENGLAAGPYTLHFLKVPGGFTVPVGDEGGTLTNGATHAGRIGAPGADPMLDRADLDTWTVTAQAGDTILANLGEPAGSSDPDLGFEPRLLVFGPAGALVAEHARDCLGRPCEAAVSVAASPPGTYTVVVLSALLGGVGDYRLSLVVVRGAAVPVSAGDEGGVATNGGTDTGRLDSDPTTLEADNGDLDAWTFEAQAGDAIEVSAVARVFGPTGALLFGATGVTPGEMYRATAPVGGVYTVVFGSYRCGGLMCGSPTDYTLRVLKLPGILPPVEPGDEGGPITNGANHAGHLVDGDLDAWTFYAQQGQAVVLGAGAPFRVYGPTGALVAVPAPGSQSQGLVRVEAAMVTVTAPLTGTYTVVVGGSTGDYSLNLLTVPGTLGPVPAGDEAGALVNGAVQLGRIGAPGATPTLRIGDLDPWTFQAQLGEILHISVGAGPPIEVSTFWPSIRLYGPTGVLVGSNVVSRSDTLEASISMTAPVTGTYTVVVSAGDSWRINPGNGVRVEYGEGRATGDYALRLLKWPGVPTVTQPGDEGGPLTNGGNHYGLIGGPGANATFHLSDLDIWTFQTQQLNERLHLTAGKVSSAGSNPNFIPWVRVYGPNGALVSSAVGLAPYVSANLGVGLYTVVVSDGSSTPYSGGLPGQYVIHFLKVPGAFTVPAGDDGGPMGNGTKHTGRIGAPGPTPSLQPGDLDPWTFEAAQGSRLEVTITEILPTGPDPGFVPAISIHGPTGAIVHGASGALTATAVLTSAPLTGTYTVVVRDVSPTSSAVGDYELRVTGATSGGSEPDFDSDGLPTAWETQFGLDPNSSGGASGATGDPDGDGRTNAQELTDGTHPRGTFQRYLAEGATSTFFKTRIALLNPGAATAHVQLRYLKGDGTVAGQVLSLPALRRQTVDVASVSGLATAEFSTVLESDATVVIDRTMTWDGSRYGSHAETGVPAPAPKWYLAEGSTASGFSLFYLIQNPSLTQASAVRITFLRPDGSSVVKTYTVNPNSRFNIWVNQIGEVASTDLSGVVETTNSVPIIVERAMYLSTPSRTFAAGHESAGITAPAQSWFLAEGATGPFFDEFVLIANPNPTAAQVRATYLLPSGTTLTKDYSVPATSRFNIWVDQENFPGIGKALTDTAVSVTLQAQNGVSFIAERAMWWPGPTFATWAEAHNSPGATATGTKWALAEGEVGATASTDQADTYILLANTSASMGSVKVTLLFEDGTSAEKTFGVSGRSRFNVWVKSEFPTAAGKRFGAIIESLGAAPAQLVVERAMYSNANGVVWAAGTNALATRLQ